MESTMDGLQDPNYDVPDSTDWLKTPLSGLMSVEQALRCHVCKDFYISPMLTSCSHTFCSLCIRRCLAVDGKCPLCRKTDQESRLRGNWALREAVDEFKKHRAGILEFARRPVPARSAVSPKRKAAGLEGAEEETEHAPKRPRRSTRSSKTRGSELAAPMEDDEVVDDSEASDPAEEYKPDDGLVACPICWERMKENQVDRHISTGSCPGAPQSQSHIQGQVSHTASSRTTQSNFLSSSKTKPAQPSKVLEPLPTPNYRILKDQQLRKKLSELNISTFGSRQLLEQRYKEWVTIWNANCDSAHPKTRTELLRDLDTWERSLGGGSRTNVIYGVPQASQPQVKDKNFDGSAWAASHDSSFKDLIAKARQTKKQAEQRTQEGSEPGKEGAEPTRPSLIQEPETRVIETGSRGSRNRYHDEINGFDGAADFITPPTVEPANSRDGVWQP